jgi:hypothetical protein
MRGWLNLKDRKGPDWPKFRSSSVTVITTIIIGGITTTTTIIITTIIITKAHKEKGTQADVPFFPASRVTAQRCRLMSFSGLVSRWPIVLWRYFS